MVPYDGVIRTIFTKKIVILVTSPDFFYSTNLSYDKVYNAKNIF
jgi:hypothetical protein